MIPLETIFALLDMLRAEAIEGVEAGTERDAFGFGTIHGQLRVLGEMRERINALVESINQSEDED